MARLIYTTNASVDGYINDADGKFEWSAPDAEFFARINALERPIGTYVYGRRMYETMRVWGASDVLDSAALRALPAELAEPLRDYAELWRAADKIVVSRSRAEVTTARTKHWPTLDLDGLRALKAQSARDVSIGGATIAGQAIAAGLVDEVRLFLHPVAVGGGTPMLPKDARVKLQLTHEQRLASGVVHLIYRLT